MASVTITGSILSPGVTNWTIDGTVTSVTLGGLPCTFDTGTLTVPYMKEGLVYPRLSANNTLLLNGTDSQSFMVLPPNTLTHVTLTSVAVGVGCLGNYLPCAIGDQLILDTPAALGLSVHEVTPSGVIKTNSLSTFTIWHRKNSDGIITQLLLNNAGELIDLTGLTKNPVSPFIDGRPA